MNKVKASFLHKLGNFIGGFCKLIDGLILIFTLGNISPDITLKWNIRRRQTSVLTDNKK